MIEVVIVVVIGIDYIQGRRQRQLELLRGNWVVLLKGTHLVLTRENQCVVLWHFRHHWWLRLLLRPRHPWDVVIRWNLYFSRSARVCDLPSVQVQPVVERFDCLGHLVVCSSPVWIELDLLMPPTLKMWPC